MMQWWWSYDYTCDEATYAMGIALTNMANAISTNVSTNYDGKKSNKKLIV